MQKIYKRTPMPKSLIEITLRDGCFPVNLLRIFRTPFPKNTSGGLLLTLATSLLSLSAPIVKPYTITQLPLLLTDVARLAILSAICSEVLLPFKSSIPW